MFPLPLLCPVYVSTEACTGYGDGNGHNTTVAAARLDWKVFMITDLLCTVLYMLLVQRLDVTIYECSMCTLDVSKREMYKVQGPESHSTFHGGETVSVILKYVDQARSWNFILLGQRT